MKVYNHSLHVMVSFFIIIFCIIFLPMSLPLDLITLYFASENSMQNLSSIAEIIYAIISLLYVWSQVWFFIHFDLLLQKRSLTYEMEYSGIFWIPAFIQGLGAIYYSFLFLGSIF